jgi:hypothetical protein
MDEFFVLPPALIIRGASSAQDVKCVLAKYTRDLALVQWEKRWPPGCHYSMTEIVFSRYLPSSAISYQLEAATLCWYHL